MKQCAAYGSTRPHIATSLAVAACQQSYRVRFFTAASLTNELLEAQAAHRLTRFEANLLRLDLIILDEVGFVPFTKAGADLLFSCLAALHEHVSLIVTTTVPFAHWAELVGGDQRLLPNRVRCQSGGASDGRDGAPLRLECLHCLISFHPSRPSIPVLLLDAVQFPFG
jgi:DNA replication protein DnaC